MNRAPFLAVAMGYVVVWVAVAGRGGCLWCLATRAAREQRREQVTGPDGIIRHRAEAGNYRHRYEFAA